MPNLKSKSGVEIFSAGVWNGDKYTIEDLDEMVRAFTDTRDKILPHLKLGHNNEQKLLQNDGLPSAGWIGNLYRQGEKLVADFVDIPAKIFALLESKAYRKVSSEIFWNIKINGKLYKRMVSAVAMLGQDMPAVTNLDDILALYGIKEYDKLHTYGENKNDILIKTIDYTKEDEQMAKDVEKLEKELAEAKKYSQGLEDEKTARDKKDEAAQKELKEYKQKVKDAEKAQAQAELDKSITELEKDGLCSKAMKPYISALLGEDKKDYSITVKTGKDKEEVNKHNSKAELLKETLKLFKASDVNLDNDSVVGDENENGFDEVAEAEKLMKENSGNKEYTFRDATDAVLKMKKEKEKGE